MQTNSGTGILSTVTAIATIATPICLAVFGSIGWLIKRRLESAQAREIQTTSRIRDLEDRLRNDRIEAYDAILEPFLLLFTSDAAFATDKKYKGQDKTDLAISRMLSVEYRKVAFKLSLVANDEVLRAYNDLMQFFYHMDGDLRELDVKTSDWIAHMSTLLLAIRRSMGNESTRLGRWEMIEWFMTDAHKLKTLHAQSETRRLPSARDEV